LWGAAALGLLVETPAAHAEDGQTIVVSATRSGQGVDRDLVGSSVTVIDPQQIEDRETRIVSDVLRDVPGVAVNRRGAIGGLTQVRIRGTEGNHVLVFVDGIKASDPYQGEFDWATLIADDAARIEVLRGQQSALYGSDAIGGVISYTTLSGREAPGIRLRAEGGSFGTYDGSARIAGIAGQAFDYALSGALYHTNGYPTAQYHSDVGPLTPGERDVGSDSLGLSAKANWIPSGNLRVSGVVRYGHVRADSNDTATGPAQVDGYPVGTTIDTPGVYYANRAWSGLLRAELASSNGAMTTALSAQFSDTRRDGHDPSPYGFGDYGDHGTRYRGSLENTLKFGGERAKSALTLAADIEREQFRNTADPSAILYGKHRLDTAGLVAQYTLTLDDRLGLSGSLRHDFNQRFADDTTWHAEASYLFKSGTRLHAAAGKGVKNPTATELYGYYPPFTGNPALRPEQSTGWEAGIDQSFAGRAVTIGATYFRSRLIDWITTCYGGAPDFASTPCNRPGVTRQQGMEAFGEARLGAVRIAAAWTYLDAPQEQNLLAGTQTIQAVQRPRHIASVNLTYAPSALPLAGTLTVRYNGRADDLAFGGPPAYPTLLVSLHSYTLVNLALRYRLSHRIELFVRGENLLDEDYQEVFAYRAAGRALYGGVRARF
jgi:vitamin B12 transporter